MRIARLFQPVSVSLLTWVSLLPQCRYDAPSNVAADASERPVPHWWSSDAPSGSSRLRSVARRPAASPFAVRHVSTGLADELPLGLHAPGGRSAAHDGPLGL